MSTNIVSVDFLPNREDDFAKYLSENCNILWDNYALKSNYKQKDKLTECKRYFKYIQAGWHLFLHRNKISNIIAWQQFHGIFFAFFCHLFHVRKKTNLIIMTLIYKRKSGFAGTVYEKFMKYTLTDKYVDHVVCFSENEIYSYRKFFNLSKNKYTYLKVAAESIKGFDWQFKEPRYIFSAGYSHRDFDFLINAVKDTNYKLIIADDRVNDPNLPNVIIKRGCYGDDMLSLLGSSYIFINPLKDKTISAGHLMTISAMQLHKPTISTASDGMKPYLIDGVTGFFIDNTKEKLIEKLNLLYRDEKLYKNMCDEAFKFGESQFSWHRLAKDVCKIASDNKIF